MQDCQSVRIHYHLNNQYARYARLTVQPLQVCYISFFILRLARQPNLEF